MVWKWLRQQQQRGAQLGAGDGRPAGSAPDEAIADREAQDHDYADLQVSDGEPQRGIDYPATDAAHRHGDIPPGAPDPHVNWDDVVQPERSARRAQNDDLPLPEGK